MPLHIPSHGHIQFPSTSKADLHVLAMTDPNGLPVDVLDVDLGFIVSGRVDFPNWLTGTVNIAIYADEIGGNYKQKILSKDFTVTATGGSPGLTSFSWSLSYPADLPSASTPLPDPQPDSPVYELVAVLTFLGPPTDIGGFVEIGTAMLT